MKKVLQILILMISVLSLGGWAIKNSHQYNNISLDLHEQGTSTIAIAVLDHRKYILNKEKKSNFVGLQRGGYGNPFDVITASGKPLAEDIANTVGDSLAEVGFEVIQVDTNPSDNLTDIIEILTEQGAKNSLLFVLREWKSDSYQNTALKYDVTLNVLDKNGSILSETNISGNDDLRGSFWTPAAYAKQVISQKFKEKFETLLNNKEVWNFILN